MKKTTIENIRMQDINKSFLENPVLTNVSVEFRKGEIHALLGENGAGKTTLMNVLTGVYSHDKGAVFIDDKPVHFKSPGESLKAGIGMVHQRFSLVGRLNVLENLTLGDPQTTFFINYKKLEEKLREYATLFSFDVDPYKKVDEYPIGSQQKIEIIKMLMRNVSMLILDEPTSVLTAQESDKLIEVLRKIAQSGKSVIFISHKMNEVMQVADKITILRKGCKVATIDRQQATLKDLALMMVGRELNPIKCTPVCFLQKGFLHLKNICLKDGKRNILDQINLTIKEGEIIGIAGVDGNGQREMADIITGHVKPDSGTVIFNDKDITKTNILDRIHLGFGYIPENQAQVGTAGPCAIWENLSLKCFNSHDYSKFGFLKIKKLKEKAKTVIDKYAIANAGMTHPTVTLSGGNLQKVIVGREIEQNGSVYVFIHPARGLDISATNFVRHCILDLRNRGKIVILISGDLDELTELSDKMAVMYEGKIMGILNPEQYNPQTIGFLMSGITEIQEN